MQSNRAAQRPDIRRRREHAPVLRIVRPIAYGRHHRRPLGRFTQTDEVMMPLVRKCRETRAIAIPFRLIMHFRFDDGIRVTLPLAEKRRVRTAADRDGTSSNSQSAGAHPVPILRGRTNHLPIGCQSPRMERIPPLGTIDLMPDRQRRPRHDVRYRRSRRKYLRPYVLPLHRQQECLAPQIGKIRRIRPRREKHRPPPAVGRPHKIRMARRGDGIRPRGIQIALSQYRIIRRGYVGPLDSVAAENDFGVVARRTSLGGDQIVL
jgi:hypothetical protein